MPLDLGESLTELHTPSQVLRTLSKGRERHPQRICILDVTPKSGRLAGVGVGVAQSVCSLR